MFKLMRPSGYPAPYRLELDGPVSGTPDIQLLRLREEIRRSTLPPFLDSLVFNFVEVPGIGVHAQSFYHLGDFFVVSDKLKKFLEAYAGCAFETKPIRTKQPNGGVAEQFWAMKVTTRVDCILPDESFAKKDPWSTDGPTKSFRELAQEIKLSADIAPYFANKGPDTYSAYPGIGVQDVSMDFSSAPKGTWLFEPLYWPQYLVIDDAFASQLDQQCYGGTLGYYFWTSGFNDVDKEHWNLMHALR